MTRVFIDEEGDSVAYFYSPHDQSYDIPHFAYIPVEGLQNQYFVPGPKNLDLIKYQVQRMKHTMSDSQRERIISLRGSGGPSGTPPTSTVPSKASSGRASAQAKKYGGPRQSSQRGGRARGKCPKGHYWSYKLKKCVRSKFK